jgi:hypothetical protein
MDEGRNDEKNQVEENRRLDYQYSELTARYSILDAGENLVSREGNYSKERRAESKNVRQNKPRDER